MSDFNHEPVLLQECIELLRIRENGVYIDGTVGGAGHSSHILEHLGKDGILIGLDQDDDAVSAAAERLQKVKDACRSQAEYIIVKTNFEKMTETAGCILRERGRLPQADGILLDIGVSSYQFDKPERGFSYRFDAPLDMRMNRDGPVTAEDVVNEYPEKSLPELSGNTAKKSGRPQLPERFASGEKLRRSERRWSLQRRSKLRFLPERGREEAIRPKERFRRFGSK